LWALAQNRGNGHPRS